MLPSTRKRKKRQGSGLRRRRRGSGLKKSSAKKPRMMRSKRRWQISLSRKGRQKIRERGSGRSWAVSKLE